LEKLQPSLLSFPTIQPRQGRPSKHAKHNISGFKNQSRKSPSLEASSNASGGDYSDSETLDLAELDTLAYLEVDSDHSDNDNEVDWDEVANEEFQDHLFGLLAQIEEDQQDAGDDDWVPTRQAYTAKWVAEERKAGGEFYDI
jgi:hypothetical protein